MMQDDVIFKTYKPSSQTESVLILFFFTLYISSLSHLFLKLDTGKVTDTPVLVVGEGTVTTAAASYFKQLEYLNSIYWLQFFIIISNSFFSAYQAGSIQDALSLLKSKKIKVILCQAMVGETSVMDFITHANSLIDDLIFIGSFFSLSFFFSFSF